MAKTDEKFTKGQLMQSKAFADQRDILQAVLEDEQSYSIKEAEALVSDYLNRKV